MTSSNAREELPADVKELVESQADAFDEALERGDFAAAEDAARASWDAIPDPKEQWRYYPDVLPRDYADLFARAGDVDRAKGWLRIAMGSKPARIGENVPLDRIAARIHAAMGDRETAERIAGALLEMHGERPFRGDDRDLLPYARAHRGRASEQAAGEAPGPGLPSPEDGAATERADLDAEIERLSEAGGRAADDEDWNTAVREWTQALEVVPAPRSEWTASTWLYTSIGDAHYQADRLDEALEALRAALKCPDGVSSPFLWLRLGQVLVDGDEVEPGVKCLLNAYMFEGAEIFDGEDPRYWRLLREHVDLDALDDDSDEDDEDDEAPPPPSGTSAPYPKPTNAEWNALAEQVAAGFRELFADADGFLGPNGLRLLRSSLASVSLRGENKVRDLTSLLVLADLAGRGDVLLAGAGVLRAVPFTGNITIFESVRQTFCGAYRRASLNGDGGEPFAPLIELPGGRESGDESRGILRRRADGWLLRPPTERAAATAPRPAAHHVLNTCLAVQELYLMWAFGGGEAWPRERIDAEIGAAAGILRRLRAIGSVTAE